MALTAKQQTQYNQLIAAGASQSAAMNAAMLVPDTAALSAPSPSPQPPTPSAPTTGPSTGGLYAPGYQAPSGGSYASAVDPTTNSPAQIGNVGLNPQFNYGATPTTVSANSGSPTVQTSTYTPTDMSGYAQPPQSADPTGGAAPSLPQTNLQKGSQGQDVAALQQYLVQQGYLTPDQLATGQGVYGPQTTAAVAKLQQDLGIQAGSGAGAYGPQTRSALSSKYNNLFQSMGSSQAPNQPGQASAAIAAATQPSTDPVFGAMASSLGPIMQSLNQVLQNINNPALTAVSLQQEYNQLAQQNNLPQMQTDMLNMQRIMTGTEDDIRDEVSKAGGTITESQVLAMTAGRNKVILKQYNSLATQYQAAQTNVSNMMQYATQDQATQLQRETATAGIVGNMASIESQMLTMGMTMQQNAKQAVQYNVTQTGYTGLAASAQGNPQMLGYYEQMLNLAPGTLSNPTQLAALDTYKQQQLAIAQQNANNAGNRTYIYGVSQGVTPPGGGTVTNNGTVAPVTITPSQLVRPQWLDSNVPLSMSSSDMSQYLQTNKGAVIGGTAGTNQYGNNVTAPNIGNYVVQPDGSYYLGAALPAAGTGDVNSLISMVNDTGSKVPLLNYTDIKSIEANAPPSKYGTASTAFYRQERSARQLVQNYIDSPTYQTVSTAPLPFARIQAARNGDNSISDLELVDSYITLAKGNGSITEAQVDAINKGASVSDKLNIIKQKVAGAGALISADQRKSLLGLAGSVFDQYASQYQNLYTQAVNVLAGNHFEPTIWGVIPDFSTMISQGDTYAKSNQ